MILYRNDDWHNPLKTRSNDPIRHYPAHVQLFGFIYCTPLNIERWFHIYKAVAVAQSVRTFIQQAKGWVFESQVRQNEVVKTGSDSSTAKRMPRIFRNRMIVSMMAIATPYHRTRLTHLLQGI